jgi:hypothetical protein
VTAGRSFADSLRGCGAGAIRDRDEAEFALKRRVREHVAAHPGQTDTEIRSALRITSWDWTRLVTLEGVRCVECRKGWGAATYWPTEDR